MTRANALDPITIELIGSALSSIVEEMGEALIRASYSTNIKERRDCSTALFDIHGNTLCQAEHIPMHLGAMLSAVKHILKRYKLEDIAETEAIFTTLMGEDVESRRKFIEDNALDVKNLDI